MMSNVDSKESPKFWKQPASKQVGIREGLTEDEYDYLLRGLGRQPNYIEIGIATALFSEHCSYKSTKDLLKSLPTTGENVICGPGENAGVIDIGEGVAAVFKVESHNHPTFIEPYQGAATGVGGILRDVFTMGARPIALMNAIFFGPAAKPYNKYLLANSVKGIGDYGNCVGVPTVAGETTIHPCYNENCLINAFALGIVEKERIFYGRARGIGNPIYYIGSKTGRDGIHGATMASDEFAAGDESKRPTVQVGDPFQEKLLLEACLEAMHEGLIVGIQDMGAAGLASSSYEMAHRGGCGLNLHLDRVPQREEGMNPYEIMLSESQERMLVVADKEGEDKLKAILAKWGLDAVNIGEVIADKRVNLYWNGELISSMDPSILSGNDIPKPKRPIKKPPALFTSEDRNPLLKVSDRKCLNDYVLRLLNSENICSKHSIYSQYDSTVRVNTVIHPGNDAGVVRIKPLDLDVRDGRDNKRIYRGVAMSIDSDPVKCNLDPCNGTMQVVCDAFRNISAVGAKPLAVTNCLNFGSPEDPEVMWCIKESIEGLKTACLQLDMPVVSGNVSLYNSTDGKPIHPTPVVACVGVIEDASKAVNGYFDEDKLHVYIIGGVNFTLNGSYLMYSLFSIENGNIPQPDFDCHKLCNVFIREAAKRNLITSVHDVSKGGIAIALCESCVSGRQPVGVTVSIESRLVKDTNEIAEILFGECGCAYIVSCCEDKVEQFEELVNEKQLSILGKGITGGERIVIEGMVDLDVSVAREQWLNGMGEYL